MTRRRAMTTFDRKTVAYVTPENGAYLIHWVGDLVVDVETVWLFGAAGSKRTAKQVARKGAIAFGYLPPFRWEWVSGTGMELTAKVPTANTKKMEASREAN